MRQHRTETEWSGLVKEWSASGESALIWCRTNRVGYQSFLNWRRRFSESQSLVKSTGPVHSFCEVVDDGGLSAEVGGLRLHLERGFDPVLLRDVVAALRGA